MDYRPIGELRSAPAKGRLAFLEEHHKVVSFEMLTIET